jgi:DNA-binding Xre family transcriptional regulator
MISHVCSVAAAILISTLARALVQRDLAAGLEISPVAYSRLERGVDPMTVDQLVAIAEKLECCPGDLLWP